MPTHTPAEEFMRNRRQRGKHNEFKPSNKIARLPGHKIGQFATSITKIKADPQVVAKYDRRKVHLISKKRFQRMNEKPEEMMFGSIRIRET